MLMNVTGLSDSIIVQLALFLSYEYCRNKLLLTEKATSMAAMQINCVKYLHLICNFFHIVLFVDFSC